MASDGKVTISTALDNKGLLKSLGGLTKTVTKTVAAITVAFATAAAAITKQSVEAYAEYEQLAGGVETLFKNSASKVKAYAENAFYTAGVSANKYMETVTSFSASLISSLGGNTEKAADVANMAMVDMSDNANKMGTAIESIQNAYQGFAKQNYTMLDNLKLGYGGTKTEMERLLADAQKLTGVKYNISNLSDVYTAIHVIQEELDIAGTTAKEAEKTITGAGNMTKAAWKNVLVAISGGGDLDKAINNLVYSISKYFENIVPVVERALSGIGQLIEKIAPQLVQTVATALIKALPSLLNAVYQMIIGLANGIYQGIVALFTGSETTSTISAQLNEVSESASDAASAEEDLAAGITEANKAAKKSLAGFDELNIIQSNTSDGSGSSATSGSSSSAPVTSSVTVTPGNEIDTTQIKKVAEIIKEIAGYVPVIAAGLAGLKLGKFITDLLTANTKAETLKDTIALLGKKAGLASGITLAITGIAFEIKGIADAIQEGLNGINFAEIIGGGGALAAGGALIGKFFGNAILGGAIGGIVAGIPMFITGIYDAIVGGIDWLNATLIGVGATAAGAGIGAIIGMLGGPIGAGIGALIGLAVGLVTDLVILIVQNWDAIVAWCGNACAAIGQFFVDLWNGIVSVWNVCAEWFNTWVITPVVDFFCGLWAAVSGFFVNLWNDIVSIWNVCAEWFDTYVIQPVGEFFAGIWQSISQWASDAWENIKEFFAPAFEWFSELFSSIWQTISDVFYNIGVIASGCWEIIKKAWSIVSEWFNKNVIQPVCNFFIDLWDEITSLASDCWNAIKNFFISAAAWFDENVIQPVCNFFTDLWNGISSLAGTCWAAITDFFAAMPEWFDTNVIQPVAGFFGELWKSVENLAVSAWEGIKSVFSTIGNWISDNIIEPVSEFFSGLWDGFTQKASDAWEGVKSVFGKVASFFSDTFEEAWEGVVKVFSVAGEIFTDIKEGILTAFKKIVNSIISGLNKVVKVPFDGINWALKKIRDINILGLTPFSSLKTISVPQIPYLAQGAVLPPNKPFMAVVGDQKHGTNIEAPLSTIQEAVALVMEDQVAAMLTGFEALLEENRLLRQIVENIEIGDTTIGAAAQRYNRKMQVARGGL